MDHPSSRLALASFLLALALCLAFDALAAAPAFLDGPVLIQDSAEMGKLPRSFRTCRDPLRKTQGQPPSREGLEGLNASASGQFSEAELREMLTRLPSGTTLVDLRQEAHGFAGGVAVSWKLDPAQARLGRTTADTEREEKSRLKELEGQKTVGLLVQRRPDKDLGSESIVIPVKRVFSEADLAPFYGLGYLRLAVPENPLPRDEDVDAFLAALAGLPPGTWLHFHDGLGQNRAATFLLLYDIWRNAAKVPLDDLEKRQALLAPPNPQTDAASRKPVDSKEKTEFWRLFHAYAKENQGKPKQTWSQYRAAAAKR